MLKKALFIITFFTLFALFGCGEKFDKTKWAEYDELDGPDRDLMAEDLLKTHKLIGLTNKQMLQLLGPPANFTDTPKRYYVLKEEYDMIDPVSGKYLVIQLI